jgi:LDH2 family malate/lactate/ureidoglycolate dehydrogenase
VDTLRAARPAREDRPVLIPGDPERAAREDRLARGIPMPEALRAAIRTIAGAAGAPFLLEADP